MKYILIIGAFALLVAGLNYLNEPNSEDELVTETNTSELDNYVVDASDFVDGHVLIAEAAQSDLTSAEETGLLYMREEEKLARDVYQALYEKWGAQIFSNISGSEQTHMDAILVLLNRYSLEDPVLDKGQFSNSELQTLYENLVAEGSKSLADAYVVGATIEDLDIADLDKYLLETDNEDIKLVYEQLQKGSRNHLRAFNRQIVRTTGENYTPVYISSSLFEEIVGSGVERGGGRNGAGQWGGSGQGGRR